MAAGAERADPGEVVHSILRARDHYAAISASRDASTPELRRCYLRASVQVHPDKNRHPDATKAFQRVAQAWAVLCDDERRRRYDTELRRGLAHHESDSDGEQEMSPEEAFAAFAFAAAAAMAAGGSMGDLAETLFMAQQLNRFRQLHQMHGARGVPMVPTWEVSQPFRAVASGLAFTAGLWTCGQVLGSCGLLWIGGAARRVAMFQAMATIATAAQQPAVREAATKGAAAVAERTRQVASSIGGAESTWSMQGLVERATQQVQSLPPQLQLCLPGPRKPAAARAGEAEEASSGASDPDDNAPFPSGGPKRLRSGTWVRLCNLRKAHELEGRLGEVVRYDRAISRYQVRLLPAASHAGPTDAADPPKLVRRENLRLAVERSAEPPSGAMAFI